MKRAIILVLDSFGIGASQDAPAYGDSAANTFLNIAKARAAEGVPLQLPNLYQLGLGLAATASCGEVAPGADPDITPIGSYGYAVEVSVGKDTPSGHWEMAGLPVDYAWGVFQPSYPSFPDDLIAEFCRRCELPGVLGNKHASGTDIINEFAQEHIASGKPIVYTSADSVFQIAAHEQHFGLDKLYHCCDVARELVDPLHIGRVIARPFVGANGDYTRTANRKDLATPPHGPTLLDVLLKQGRQVHAIGKIADIFAHRGISQIYKGADNMALFEQTLVALTQAQDGDLIFANFVDFDSHYGHRRDIAGYANALEEFDKRLPELLAQLSDDDLLIFSADHGCDPTQPGSDHTREHIPVLVYGKNHTPHFLGRRESFADIGQSVAKHLAIPALDFGVSFV